MIKFYSILQLECDQYSDTISSKQKPKRFCWKEMMIYLEEGEIKPQAIHYVETLGWEIDNDIAICPYCSKGLKKKEMELKLLKGGRV